MRAEEGGERYHAETHALLISVRAVALNKDGSGFQRGRDITNLRPLGIGDSLRRIAAQCQLLQLSLEVGSNLAGNGQCGCGVPYGTDTVYHTVSKCLNALVASGTPGGSVETDARNAYCSILRAAIQRGILRYTPHLPPTFDSSSSPKQWAPVSSSDLGY